LLVINSNAANQFRTDGRLLRNYACTATELPVADRC
jgi:hypothetical protein